MSTKSALLRPKLKATGIHLCISLALLLIITAYLYLVWYPSFYLGMSGGIQGVWLILGVDMILGPLLTFLIFNHHKKQREILTDFITIGIIQLSALVYGIHIIYQERPQLILMFTQGTATILNAREVAENPKLTSVLYQTQNTIESIKVSLNLNESGQVIFLNPLTKPLILEQLTSTNRQFITQPDELKKLKAIESQHSQIYILSMMGKYTGAYIILDPELNYLGKIGEKPIS